MSEDRPPLHERNGAGEVRRNEPGLRGRDLDHGVDMKRHERIVRQRRYVVLFVAKNAAADPRARGDRLPHDELISILGSGGIERVYPAHDWRPRRDVAVKVLTPEAAKPEMRLGFEREARAMAGRDNLWT